MSNRVKVDATLQANKAHQEQVKSYIDRLEAELAVVDDLIETTTTDPDEGQESSEFGTVEIPGAGKPTSLILQSGLLSETSPFYEDAKWRETYESLTTLNPLKGKEQEALRRAVRSENQRITVLAAQAQGKTSALPNDVPATHYEKNKEGLDWNRIANKVSDSIQSISRRKPEECEIRWLGYLHPDINKSPWSSEELADLRELLKDFSDNGPVDWMEVARKLGTGRSAMDCMCHGALRKVHAWDADSDKKLLDCIRMYGENNWSLVAMSVSEDATVHQCQKRFYETLDPNLKRGPWSDEEDTQLIRAVAAFSTPGQGKSANATISWQDVALFVPGRTNNQCREHYQVKFKAKGGAGIAAEGWTREEDAKLTEAVSTIPEGQWKEVSERVGGGRTEEMCQRRFETLRDGEDEPRGSGTEADAPPAKKARKYAAPKARGKKAKGVEVTDGEQISEGQPSTSVETASAPKRRVRPKPGMFKKGGEGVNMFGEVDKGSEAAGSGTNSVSGGQGETCAEAEEQHGSSNTTLPNESSSQQNVRGGEVLPSDGQPFEQVKKRGRQSVSAKARGKQKTDADAEENPTNEPADTQQQPEQDNATTQKKRPGRKPKAKTTEPPAQATETLVEPPPPPQIQVEGGVNQENNANVLMEVDEPEPSNRRRSARLKSTKK